MISGQTITHDAPTEFECECMAQGGCAHSHIGTCRRKPARDFMLSGWPDSMVLCDSCSARLRRPDLDLTRDCALCGRPIQLHAANGRINGYRGCYCQGRCRVAERKTHGRYYCTRAPGHSGPCAAVPVVSGV